MITVDVIEGPYTEKFSRLESVNSKLNNALDQIPSLLSLYQLGTGKEYVASEIYAAASERIGQLIPFKVSAFFEMACLGADLEVSYTSCSRQEISLTLEVERLVEDKVIDWVVERRLPVILESEEKDENLILHALVTATGVRGLFVAVLANNTEHIADCDLSLLSILLYNLANSIELCELEVVGKRSSLNQGIKGEMGFNGQNRARIINNDFTCYDKFNQPDVNGQPLLGCGIKLMGNGANNFSKDSHISFDSKIIINEKINFALKLSNSFNELKNPINFIRINLEFLKRYLSDVNLFIDKYSYVENKYKYKGNNIDRINKINSKTVGLFDSSTRDDLNSIFLESDNGLGKIDDFISSVGKFYKKSEQDVPVIFDINNLVEETLTFTEKLFQGEGKFSVDFGNVPSLLGYPLLLKDVFLSLFQRSIVAFDNQLRSTPGFIVIKTWVDKQKIWCTINDDGPGVMKDDRQPDGNFSPYSLTDDWYLTNASLAIVQDVVVNKHKGDVSVAYGEGSGSIITIQLPVWDCDNESSDSCLV